MRFVFLNYDQSIFDQALVDISEIDKSMIVVDGIDDLSMLKKSCFDKFGINGAYIVTKEELKELVFLKEKSIVKGDARLIAFYNSLSEDHKKRFRINNIFDCIEFGKRFFRLHEDLGEERKVRQEDLYEWQKKVFTYLEEMKLNYKQYMVSNGMEDRMFVYNPGRVDIQRFVGKIKEVICVNLISVSRLEKHIFESLTNSGIDVRMYLQIFENDYDTYNLQIKYLTIPKLSNVQIKECPDNFIQNITALNDMRALRKSEDVGNIKVNKHLKVIDPELGNVFSDVSMNYVHFQDTELYSFLSALSDLLNNLEFINDQLCIRTSYLVKSNIYFLKYYNITPKDKRSILTLARSGYKYIPKGFALFDDLFIDLEQIINIKTFDDFMKYIREKNFEMFKNIKYKNLFEVFYNSLSELQAINSNFINGDWKLLFPELEIAEGLLRFILQNLYCKKIYLSLNEEQNVFYSSILSNESVDNLFILNFDDKFLHYNDIDRFFLTNDQRKNLNLIFDDMSHLEAKYRYIRYISSAKNVYIYYIKDLDRGRESSALLEEIKVRNDLSVKNLDCAQDSYSEFANRYFETKEVVVQDNKLDGLSFNKDDIIGNDNEFSIGFYDYNDLVKCKYRYYLKSVVKLSLQQSKVIYRIDPNLLGNIIHNVLNEVAEIKLEEVKQNNFFVNKKDVESIVYKIVQEESFKIPVNYKRYYETILFPFIVQSTMAFYEMLSRRLQNEKIEKFFIEISEKKVMSKDGKDSYVIKGKADLRIETERQKYIIDYKTGHTESKQLDFYHVLYYTENDNVIKWFYKFFDESIKDEVGVEIFREEIVANIESLVHSEYYERTPNKSICKYCEYLEICKVRGI